MCSISDKGNDAVAGHIGHPRRRFQTVAVDAWESLNHSADQRVPILEMLLQAIDASLAQRVCPSQVGDVLLVLSNNSHEAIFVQSYS